VRARLHGRVDSVLSERPGAQEVEVVCNGERRPAVVYTAITGPVQVGDYVHLNTWAVELGLGTGGLDFVIANDSAPAEAAAPGHVMKLRYTPCQLPVAAAAAQESEWHDEIGRFESLEGIPVVCAELHSQVPAIAAAAKWETKGAARVAYVMTDGAALPLAFSRLVPALKDRGLIDCTVTSGQAFGGDYEAVNLYSALIVARVCAKADVIVVAQGPGNTGTATPFGFTGVDQGVALNAASTLEGTPIAVARVSFADPRPRHRGLSHHTLTVLDRIALVPTLVPVPRLEPAYHALLRQALSDADLLERHEFITVDAEPGLAAFLDSGVAVSTMGRSVQEERAFFLSAAAAGLLAGQCFAGEDSRSEVW
jgi:hypothetical protein